MGFLAEPAMSDDIARLCNAIGLELPEQLPPGEVVAIEMGRDGRLIVTVAAGVRHVLAMGGDVAPAGRAGGMTGDDLLRLLVPDIARYGGRLPIGVPFLRRRIVRADGTRGIIFTPAGR
jgi:hypothetical protein